MVGFSNSGRPAEKTAAAPPPSVGRKALLQRPSMVASHAPSAQWGNPDERDAMSSDEEERAGQRGLHRKSMLGTMAQFFGA